MNLNLAEKFETSCALMKSAAHVLKRNPRLLLFPLVSGTGALAMAAFFFAPVVWLLFGETWLIPTDWLEVGHEAQALGKEQAFHHFGQDLAGGFYAYGILIYLVSMVTAVFFNVAFYHEILRALAGEAVSLRSGLRFAWSRGSAILRWSLLAGTVGLAIRALEERMGLVGRWVMSLLGTAWSVAAVFAIPVLVGREETNPLAVLRDSAATLKRTWGESVLGFLGIQMVGTLIILGLSLAAVGAVIAASALHVPSAGWGIVATWLLAVLASGLFFSVATHIYRCALYVYATEGVVPTGYSAELMESAWKVKGRQS